MLVKFTKKQLERVNAVRESVNKYGVTPPAEPFLKPSSIWEYLSAHEKSLNVLEGEKERFYVLGLSVIECPQDTTFRLSTYGKSDLAQTSLVVSCSAKVRAKRRLGPPQPRSSANRRKGFFSAKHAQAKH